MAEEKAIPALTGESRFDNRLSPAEAHHLVRQQLARLVAPWGLSEADCSRLAGQMKPRTYAPGEIIVPQGVRADCLGLVVQGQVAVHLEERGSSRPSMILLPGSIFGERMLTAGQPSRATLQALTRCQIRCLRRSDLLALHAARRVERRSQQLWRLVKVSGAALMALLLLVIALGVPTSRQSLALLPMGLGQWCEARGRMACAVRSWQVAANLNRSDPNPRLALGMIAFEQGDLAAAQAHFEAALALAPDLPEAYNNLGLIYAAQGDCRKAITVFEKALALEPGIAVTEYNLGLCLQTLEDYRAAIAHYRSALALGGPRADALVGLAVAYYQTGELDQAAEAAREALRRDDSLAAAYVILGAVALAERHPQEALADLQQAVALDEGQSQAHFFLGLAYKSLGRRDEAIAAFEEALATARDRTTRKRIRRYLNELYGQE